MVLSAHATNKNQYVLQQSEGQTSRWCVSVFLHHYNHINYHFPVLLCVLTTISSS